MDASRPAGEGNVHASYWLITEDGTYLGAITLRHELNDFLLRAGGHIGYGIRPSARGRGLATWALQSVLVKAPALGLRKVLVTCVIATWLRLASSRRPAACWRTCARPNSASPAVTGSRPESGMLRKTAGGPQPRQRDIIRPAVTASKQHRARELLQTADSALPVDGEFAMGEMRRAACSVASFCGHW